MTADSSAAEPAGSSVAPVPVGLFVDLDGSSVVETVPIGAFVDFEILTVVLGCSWEAPAAPYAELVVPSDPEACYGAAVIGGANSMEVAAINNANILI